MDKPTQAEVEVVMGPVDFDLTPFIDLAYAYVSDRLEEEIDAGTVSDTILDYLQRYIAAHYSCTRAGQLTSAGVAGGPNVDYMRRVEGPGLMSTDYGQNAISIDPTGKIDDKADEGGVSYADFKSFDILYKDY